MIHRFPRTLLVCSALIGAAAQAQTLIDQSKAMAGGITPGDAAGYPVTLSVPGSYKLTSHLWVPAGTSGIVITASGVSLDLNGFGIYSSTIDTDCSGAGATLQCKVTGGADHGVTAAAGVTDTRVQNGIVANFGGYALRLNERAIVTRLRASRLGSGGISVGEDSLLAEVSAYRAVGIGISALGGALIADAAADGNAKTGIAVGFGTAGGLVVSSRATGNGAGGMRSFSLYTNFVDNIADGSAVGATIAGGVHTAGNYCNSSAC